MAWLTDLEVTDDSSEYWVLLSPLVWKGKFDNKEMTVTVPEGYRTNLASIPRLFRPLFPVNGKHRKAAVVHDYLCGLPDVPRKKADKLFHQHMKELKVNRVRAKLMYWAVRLGATFKGKKRG